MRTKNKMDSETKSEEWWDVAKEYFPEELRKNLAKHRANERILKYKLEVYQKNFPDFICGNPTIQRNQTKMKKHKHSLMEQL
jgi:hypothetical protein